MSESKKQWLFPTLIVVAVFGCFYPGLYGPFVFDDAVNILGNEHIQLTEFTWEQLQMVASSPVDGYPFGRVLSYISFALNYYFSEFSFNPFPIKITNLFIHAFNSGLVYLLVKLLVEKIWPKTLIVDPAAAALLVALLWACHPIQVSTVLYAVQRMTLLAGTSTLLGCYFFTAYRLNYSNSNSLFKLVLALITCIAVGFHFKESAILLPLYITSLEVLIRQFVAPNKAIDRIIVGLVLVPGVLGIAYSFFHLGDIRSSYIFRNFTLEERLLTQPRVLFWYLKLILLPNLNDFSLFLDDFSISKNLFNPLTTSYALAGWLLIVISAVAYRTKTLLAASVAWFLGGHLVESSFIPLEIAFEHRNYLPSLGPIALVLFATCSALSKLSAKRWVHNFVLFSIALLVIFMGTIRSTYWGDNKLFIITSVDHRPHSARARSIAGVFYVSWAPLKALEHYQIASKFNPDALDPLTNQYVVIRSAFELYDKPVGSEEKEDVLDSLRVKWTKEALEKELGILKTEIEHRLKTQAISAQGLTMLERQASCRIDERSGCTDAQTILNWIDLAIANPKKRDRYMPFLLLYKAKMLAYLNFHEEAIAVMSDIVSNYPPDNYFKLQFGRLYQALGRTEEAEKYIGKIPLTSKDQTDESISSSRGSGEDL